MAIVHSYVGLPEGNPGILQAADLLVFPIFSMSKLGGFPPNTRDYMAVDFGERTGIIGKIFFLV